MVRLYVNCLNTIQGERGINNIIGRNKRGLNPFPFFVYLNIQH